MAYIHVYECRTSLPLIASVTRNGREHRSQVWNIVGPPTMGAAVQCYSHATNSDHSLVWSGRRKGGGTMQDSVTVTSGVALFVFHLKCYKRIDVFTFTL